MCYIYIGMYVYFFPQLFYYAYELLALEKAKFLKVKLEGVCNQRIVLHIILS